VRAIGRSRPSAENQQDRIAQGVQSGKLMSGEKAVVNQQQNVVSNRLGGSAPASETVWAPAFCLSRSRQCPSRKRTVAINR